MPRLIDPISRTGALVTAVNHLLATGGPRALSLRAIASHAGVSGSSIIHHYGSVEHLYRALLHLTDLSRRDEFDERRAEGLLAFLPAGPDGVVEARVWLAWREMARAIDGLELSMTAALAHERALVARTIDYELGGDQLGRAIALIDGLRVAVCEASRPLPLGRAREMLREAYPSWTAPSYTTSAAPRRAATTASGSSAE